MRTSLPVTAGCLVVADSEQTRADELGADSESWRLYSAFLSGNRPPFRIARPLVSARDERTHDCFRRKHTVLPYPFIQSILTCDGGIIATPQSTTGKGLTCDGGLIGKV